MSDTGNIFKKNILPLLIVLVAFVVLGIFLLFSFEYINSVSAFVFSGKKIYFNEIMLSNKESFPDKNGNFYDWIELYNDEDEDVLLSGYTITDKTDTYVWTFPADTVIPAKGYIVLFFSGDYESGLYLPFRLNRDGGKTLLLSDASGTELDIVQTKKTLSDNVMVRTDFLRRKWDVSDICTPGYENSEDGRAAFLASYNSGFGSIVINEIMAKNKMTNRDGFGEFSDWIEIKNTGTTQINLKNYYLSNDSLRPYKYSLPEYLIYPGEIIVIYCSGKNTVHDGQIHTSFNLSDINGYVGLRVPSGTVSDETEYSEIPANYSYEKTDNGFELTAYPTPGYENNSEWVASSAHSYSDSALVINEVVASNTKYLLHNGGRAYDFIELYNSGTEEIDLSLYFLSNDSSALQLWQLPAKNLAPGDFFIVFASGDETLSSPSYTHAPFKISSSGEELYLSTGSEIIDAVFVHDLPTDVSYGRSSAGTGFFFIEKVTPAAENAEGVRQRTRKTVSSVKEGVYNNVEPLQIVLSSEFGAEIRYTLDCSEPTSASPVFKEAIILSETTVIRAIAYSDGQMKSEESVFSYIINENHSVPVVSLTTSPENLWDTKTGIYVMGNNASSEYPYKGANFWMDWEKPAYISFFEEGSDGFSSGCGIKIFGNFGRAEAQKPFSVKFKEKYGLSELHYNMFDRYDDVSVFNTLVLRAGAQDISRSKFRDELFTSIVYDGTSVLTQAYKPCVLYLNGEYWGIYFIREKVDEDFVSVHENVTPESVTLLYRNGETVYGTASEYNALIRYVSSNSLSDAKAYAYVASKIDVENYIDFKLAQCYSGNIDLHNVKYYKSDESDGKWRWIFYDQDYAFRETWNPFGRIYNDKVTKLERPGPDGNPVEVTYTVSHILFRKLLENADFQALFISRAEELMSTSFSADTVNARIDNLYNLLKAEMPRNCERWDLSYEKWDREVENLRKIASSRAEIVLKDILNNLKK